MNSKKTSACAAIFILISILIGCEQQTESTDSAPSSLTGFKSYQLLGETIKYNIAPNSTGQRGQVARFAEDLSIDGASVGVSLAGEYIFIKKNGSVGNLTVQYSTVGLTGDINGSVTLEEAANLTAQKMIETEEYTITFVESTTGNSNIGSYTLRTTYENSSSLTSSGTIEFAREAAFSTDTE